MRKATTIAGIIALLVLLYLLWAWWGGHLNVMAQSQSAAVALAKSSDTPAVQSTGHTVASEPQSAAHYGIALPIEPQVYIPPHNIPAPAPEAHAPQQIIPTLHNDDHNEPAVPITHLYETPMKGGGGGGGGRISDSDDPVPPAPVLSVAGCASAACTLGTTSASLSWSSTNGTGYYEVRKDGTVVATTTALTYSLALADGATSTLTVAARHGSNGSGAAFVSNAVTVGVTVPDTTAPVITVPADISQATASTTATTTTVTFAATATDNKDGTLTPVCVPASGSTFAVGTTTVVCSATDAAGNTASSTFAVGVYLLADTVAPVISNTPADFSVAATSTNSTYAVVTFTLPTATDETNGTLTVSCTPGSGSNFAVGTTTVVCSAADAAGNTASSTFAVGVYLPAPAVPTPFTMASQSDSSYLCVATDGQGNVTDGWHTCFTDGSAATTTNLGSGAGLQGGSLLSVTVALDEAFKDAIPADPFSITISCFTDAAYTTECPDWVAATAHNGSVHNLITEQATSTDATGKFWTAYFTNSANEANNDGSAPVVFNPAYYYRLTISDGGDGWPAYGSLSLLEPYWQITGLSQ